MRTCPECSAINSDDQYECGVCGASLSGTSSLSLEQSSIVAIERRKRVASQVHARRALSKSGLAGFSTGIGFFASAAGLFVYGMSTSTALYLLLSVFTGLIGIVFLESGIHTVTIEPFRPSYRVPNPFRPSGSGGAYVNREADREEEAERKRESGEAD